MSRVSYAVARDRPVGSSTPAAVRTICRPVCRRLPPAPATRGGQSVPRRALQRQRAEIHAGHAWAAVGTRAGAGARPDRDPRARRHELSQTRHALGRGQAPILRGARHDREWPGRGLDETATLREWVTLVRSRWPIEQQYRELNDALGIDHFEGRSYRGWTHHTVLTAIAFTFLQLERRRSGAEPRPTLPCVRVWVREIMAVLDVVNNRNPLNLIASFQRNPPLRR